MVVERDELWEASELERSSKEDIEAIWDKSPTFADVLGALRSVEVPVNENRQNVKSNPDLQIRSCTFGALARSNSPARISEMSRRRPRLTRLLAAFGRAQCPEGFPFASIQLNCNYASAMHCDSSNDGPSCIVALGDFTDGQLWCLDRGVLPCHERPQVFNGNQPHCTLPFEGERYSLIFFSTAGHDRLAPRDAKILDYLGFHLPTERLTHSYKAAGFPVPHLERDYTFGFHVTTEERCDAAKQALANWREDWSVEAMDQAFLARSKPMSFAPADVCEGLFLGFARVTSATLRGDDRDGITPSGATAQCPTGLRGPVTGVVVYHERSPTSNSTVRETNDSGVDLFGVFYQDGRFEELELEEIAQSHEPPEPSQRQRAAAPPDVEWSAPKLARRALAKKRRATTPVKEEENEIEEDDVVKIPLDESSPNRVPHTTSNGGPQYEPSDEVLALRCAKNAELMAAFRVALEREKKQLSTPGRWWCAWVAAAAAVVASWSDYKWDDVVDAMIAAPRLFIRSYGGARDEQNLHCVAVAAGLWPHDLPLFYFLNDMEDDDLDDAEDLAASESDTKKESTSKKKGRGKKPVDTSLWYTYGTPTAFATLAQHLTKARVLLAFLVAIEARLVLRLGMDSPDTDDFRPTLKDVCLDDDVANEKWEELGPPPYSRMKLARAVLGKAVNYVFDGRSWPPFAEEAPLLLANLRRELDREPPPSDWSQRDGAMVWINEDKLSDEEKVQKAEPTSSMKQTTNNFRNTISEVTCSDEESSDDDLVGLKIRSRSVCYGLLRGVVSEVHRGVGTVKYLVQYDGDQGEEYLSRAQVLSRLDPFAVTKRNGHRGRPCRVVDPAKEAALVEKSPSLAAVKAIAEAAHHGYTSWGREDCTRRAEQPDVAVRLLVLDDTYVCVRDIHCLDWAEGLDMFFDAENPTHAAAKVYVDQNTVLTTSPETKEDPSKLREERLLARKQLPHWEAPDGENPRKTARLGMKNLSAIDSRNLADDDAKIEYKQDNPKREGSASHTRYDAYKTATTVQQFLRQGGKLDDLRFDYARGYVTIPCLSPPDDNADGNDATSEVKPSTMDVDDVKPTIEAPPIAPHAASMDVDEVKPTTEAPPIAPYADGVTPTMAIEP